MEELNKKFSERLQYLMKINNLKAVDLCNKTGINKVKMSLYINGKNMPKQDGLYILSNALNVSPGYLLGIENSNLINKTDDLPIKIAIIGKISAGLPILATENIEGYEFAPSSYLKKDFEYFYLKVQGDSMNMKFHEGNLILVQKQDFLENNEIGVILVDNMDATVKKYRFENNVVILEPMSTNSEHHVQIYNPAQIKIIGKVILSIGKV